MTAVGTWATNPLTATPPLKSANTGFILGTPTPVTAPSVARPTTSSVINKAVAYSAPVVYPTTTPRIAAPASIRPTFVPMTPAQIAAQVAGRSMAAASAAGYSLPSTPAAKTVTAPALVVNVPTAQQSAVPASPTATPFVASVAPGIVSSMPGDVAGPGLFYRGGSSPSAGVQGPAIASQTSSVTGGISPIVLAGGALVLLLLLGGRK